MSSGADLVTNRIHWLSTTFVGSPGVRIPFQDYTESLAHIGPLEKCFTLSSALWNLWLMWPLMTGVEERGGGERGVVVNTRSYCLGCLFSGQNNSVFHTTGPPPRGSLYKLLVGLCHAASWLKCDPASLLCNPSGGWGSTVWSSFPKHSNEDGNCPWHQEFCPSGVSGDLRYFNRDQNRLPLDFILILSKLLLC